MYDCDWGYYRDTAGGLYHQVVGGSVDDTALGSYLVGAFRAGGADRVYAVWTTGACL